MDFLSSLKDTFRDEQYAVIWNAQSNTSTPMCHHPQVCFLPLWSTVVVLMIVLVYVHVYTHSRSRLHMTLLLSLTFLKATLSTTLSSKRLWMDTPQCKPHPPGMCFFTIHGADFFFNTQRPSQTNQSYIRSSLCVLPQLFLFLFP